MNAASSTTYGSNSTISYTSGLVLATGPGETPARTPKELIATRAVESKGGWPAMMIWPQKTSQKALGKVNRRVHSSFKRLIVGV